MTSDQPRANSTIMSGAGAATSSARSGFRRTPRVAVLPIGRGLGAVWMAAPFVFSVSLSSCGAAERSAEAEAAAESEQASSGLTADERATGWRPLFDGQTLAGWRGLGMDSIPTAHWQIEGGTIRKVASGEVAVAADGQPLQGGDLMTEEVFGDFELSFEWKVAPGANSGIKYNVSEPLSMAHPPVHAALGFEYQVLDDDLHADAANPSHRAGELYNLVEANERKVLRPVGEWNSGRIVFVGNRGEHWLNGEMILEYELGTPEMDSLFAASKWSDIPEFIERRHGHIVLQDHSDDVWYRNIRVRELDGESQ